ncbi:MAG: ATP-binding protein [Paracoccaceae bacterium]
MNARGWGLRTQIALLVLSVLCVAQAISLWLFVDERSMAVQAAIAAEAAGRAANVARFIEESPEDMHSEIIRAASSPLVRFELADAAGVTPDHRDDGGAVEARVRALLEEGFSRDIRVYVHSTEQVIQPFVNLPPERADLRGKLMAGTIAALELEISVGLTGGRWLNIGTRFERPPIQWPWASTASFVLTAALLLIVSFWFLLTRLTGPLNALAAASDRLGRGTADGALVVVGPKEVRDLTHSFNTMQDRLTRFVADRTQMLAALAHDLRSPLTALRVHSDMVDDPEIADGLAISLQEMMEMVEATLDYAQGVGRDEESIQIDVTELFTHLNLAQLDIGDFPPLKLTVKFSAMRRAIRNLADNAIRYGGNAKVSWREVEDTVEILIEDDGPGIPEDQIEHVFAPYVRLETSRSQKTGGHGLGLSISRSIILAHGGTVELTNCEQRGLRATISLPKDGQMDARGQQPSQNPLPKKVIAA